MRNLASWLLSLLALIALPLTVYAGEAAAPQAAAEEQNAPVDWESWQAGNSISRSGLVAARRAQLHELLQRLPLPQVHALPAHGRRSEDSGRGAGARSWLPPGSNPSRLHRDFDAARRCGELVRQGAARPVVDRTLQGCRTTSTGYLQDLLCRIRAAPPAATTWPIRAWPCRPCCPTSRASSRRCSRPVKSRRHQRQVFDHFETDRRRAT